MRKKEKWIKNKEERKIKRWQYEVKRERKTNRKGKGGKEMKKEKKKKKIQKK